MRGPRWLIEGAAELFAFAALADAGLYDLAQARAERIAAAKRVPEPLRAFETQLGIRNPTPGAPYTLGYVAVDRLDDSEGQEALLAYWRRLATGSHWVGAFPVVFGRTLDAFYAEFEAYRATL